MLTADTISIKTQDREIRLRFCSDLGLLHTSTVPCFDIGASAALTEKQHDSYPSVSISLTSVHKRLAAAIKWETLRSQSIFEAEFQGSTDSNAARGGEWNTGHSCWSDVGSNWVWNQKQNDPIQGLRMATGQTKDPVIH